MKPWPLVLACACATPGPIAPPPAPVIAPAADARVELTARFRQAVAARRFDEVLTMLSKRWREHYDVARLAHDFDTEPLASARSDRPLTLVEEAGEWKVDSLE